MSKYVSFLLDGVLFEYDESKNASNIKKHGISFETAARVFFDYDRIEIYDIDNSCDEDRYDVIGDISYSHNASKEIIGKLSETVEDDIVFVVYTERYRVSNNGIMVDAIRIISARYATSFERRLYYGKH